MTFCAVGAQSVNRGYPPCHVTPYERFVGRTAVQVVEDAGDLYAGRVEQPSGVVVLREPELSGQDLPGVGLVESERRVALQRRELGQHRGRYPGRVVAEAGRRTADVVRVDLERAVVRPVQPPAGPLRVCDRRYGEAGPWLTQ